MKVLLLATILATSSPAETITYRVTPCLGSCPVYAVTVSSDGHAHYSGEDHVAVTGEHAFRVAPAEFDAFRARLAPYRPKPGQETLVRPDSALCPEYGTDAPSIEVTWTSAGHRTEHLSYYSGCTNPRVSPAMGSSLAHAIETLPIARFVGSKSRR